MDDGDALALACLAALAAGAFLFWRNSQGASSPAPADPNSEPPGSAGGGQGGVQNVTFQSSGAGGQSPAAMSLDAAGVQFIKYQENRPLATGQVQSSTAYPDANGYSIGYGYFGARPGETMTKAQADALFPARVLPFVNAVRTNVRVPLTQGQFNALVDFAYNEGVNAFLGSTLLRLLNAGDYSGASAQFFNWEREGNSHPQVLADRRTAENAMFTAQGSG